MWWSLFKISWSYFKMFHEVITTGHSSWFSVPTRHKLWVLFPKNPLQTSPEDCFRGDLRGTSPLRGMAESCLSLQRLHAEGGRAVQNPTSLPQGGRGSASSISVTRITRTLKLNFLEPHSYLHSPFSLPFLNPLQFLLIAFPL